jgi:exodeoxyribonuclease VII large subunit
MEQVFSVSEFLSQLNSVLETQVVLVQGEVTRVDKRAGYTFFTLKDTKKEAVLPCFIWAEKLRFCGFTLKEGLEIQIFGFPEIYARSGRFNFQVEKLQVVGEGALQKAFEQLKRKLEQLGFFASERKKPIPRFVRRLGLITSGFGEAKNDFLKHIGRHGFEILFYNVKVEGMYAIDEIVRAIKFFNESPLGELDVLVLIRGGGSLESLQAFNSEAVARAIFASRIPVIAGIGHEADFTIADFVADCRASTPTHAAKILSEGWEKAGVELKNSQRMLATHIQQAIANTRNEIEVSAQTLEQGIKSFLEQVRNFLLQSEQKLNLASPLHRLAQGYSITREQGSGRVVKRAEQVIIGQRLVTRLFKGELRSKVL